MVDLNDQPMSEDYYMPLNLTKELVEVVEDFIISEVDYMTRNNLGNPEKQHNVIRGRKILSKFYNHIDGVKRNK